jgi:hypothetical protein
MCRYLFATGISRLLAHGAPLSAPQATLDPKALQEAAKKPDNSYCRLFAE